MEHKHALGQAFYERAADIMTGGSPEERLAVLNQLWGEYRVECASYDEHVWSYSATMRISNNELCAVFDAAIRETTGYTVDQIINFAKEMMKHGTNETKGTASDTEQLG